MNKLQSALLRAAPVAAIALYGAWWITAHAGGGRNSAHTLWQSVALAETLLALLLRERKPVGAFAGVLAAYLAFDLDPLLLPGVLFALLTVAATRHRHVVVPCRHRNGDGDRRDALYARRPGQLSGVHPVPPGRRRGRGRRRTIPAGAAKPPDHPPRQRA
jgi:hypothetical protein